ncbi:hypothetical protein SDC9_182482 [bioreactor metagenome]|uniref:Uncharacterized protein n=1 Tax=bioreactor metagenome TaxID=1076179 RepID=A0A645H7N8_9ZZZZ
MSKEAMSLGLMSFIFPMKITPSSTINGSFDPEIDFCPRICMLGCPPAEFVAPISRPETFPFIASNAFRFDVSATGEFSNFTEDTEPVKSFLLAVP